jgi:hypothetical protein
VRLCLSFFAVAGTLCFRTAGILPALLIGSGRPLGAVPVFGLSMVETRGGAESFLPPLQKRFVF